MVETAETHQIVTKVWIAPGCIVCDSCENDCPEVFDVQEETCVIRPPALKADFVGGLTPSIIVAAEGCPVDVITFDLKEVPGPAPWAGKEAEAAAAARSEVAGVAQHEQDQRFEGGGAGDFNSQELGGGAGGGDGEGGGAAAECAAGSAGGDTGGGGGICAGDVIGGSDSQCGGAGGGGGE